MSTSANTILHIPLEWYHQMRDSNPVYYDARLKRWHVFRYDDALHVLNDPVTFSSEPTPESMQPRLPSILGLDEPRHRQLRSIVSQAFTPRMIAQLAPRIAEITNQLLDTVIPRGEMDPLQDLAYPLPITIIAELLGVPPEEQNTFKEWSTLLLSSPQQTTRPQHDRAQISSMLLDYLLQKLKEHQRQPRNDLMGHLLTAEVNGAKLSEEELVDFCRLLLIAGYETTANLIGNAFVCFDEHPDIVEELRRDPSLMSGAAEEILRCYPSVSGATRVTIRPTTLGEQAIDQNSTVLIHIASANYDERQFPEPERFDIRREPNRHLAFGYGIHFCLGAPLARLEARIALNLVLERLQNLQRIPDKPVEAIQTIFTFGVEHFPVTFKAIS
ncbi:MAG TPA: cytochrome P450 [Ktedonobacteraceae bacterium]|nr:cytochrome P450 [Ktedonobacteraceae bacterium]